MSIVILTKDLYRYSMTEIFTDRHRAYINKQTTKALKGGDNLQFEYYVLNYNHNKQKVESFNIFNNVWVQELTEREVRKYLRSPKKYKYESFFVEKEIIYGFDGLCKRFEQILRCEEWARSEYESQ